MKSEEDSDGKKDLGRVNPMLEAPASMTVLKLPRLPTLPCPQKMDSEQESPRKTSTPTRNTDSPSRGNGFSFSVAALLADTRPRRTPTPVKNEEPASSEDQEDEDLDLESGAEDEGSIVDVEVSRDGESPRTPPSSVGSFLQQHQAQVARLMLPVTPVRPTPFSALAAAAAAYSAGLQQPHSQGWGVHGHYPGPPVFPNFGSGLSGSPGK